MYTIPKHSLSKQPASTPWAASSPATPATIRLAIQLSGDLREDIADATFLDRPAILVAVPLDQRPTELPPVLYRPSPSLGTLGLFRA